MARKGDVRERKMRRSSD